jgi:hypothetical protein
MGRIILSALLVMSAAGVSRAELIYGIGVPGATTNLVFFDSATPQNFTTVGAISGIVPGQTLRGIDFRPSNGQLYAMSSSGTAAQLYTVNLATAVATPVGAGLTLTGNTSTRISLDFNPVPDALRVVTGSGQSYRVNANTGALIAQDTNISGTPLISGIAYTNNNFGATQTTLYGYDFNLDNLGTIGGINGVPSPNGGLFTVVGPSGIVTFNAGLGFDISGLTGIGYVSVDDASSPGANAEFYTLNLATGTFTRVGPLDVLPVLDISVRPRQVPEPVSVAVFGGLLLAGGVVARRRMSKAA